MEFWNLHILSGLMVGWWQLLDERSPLTTFSVSIETSHPLETCLGKLLFRDGHSKSLISVIIVYLNIERLYVVQILSKNVPPD